MLILLSGIPKKKQTKQKIAKPEKNKKKGSAKNSKSSEKSKESSKSSKKSKSNSKKSKKSSKSSNKSSSSKKSKGSSKKGKKKKEFISDTLINIPEELLLDLLEESLQIFKQGLIIESLTSNFLRKTMVALKCLLQLAKDVQEIHFVIFSTTFEKYMESETIKEQELIQQEINRLEELEGNRD